MNKRRRAILDASADIVAFAMANQPAARSLTDVPGLSAKLESRELMIYGTIGGGGWFTEGISAGDVARALKDLGHGHVDVRINSGGGDVFDGIAIHTLLSRHPGGVTTHVDGLAASAASFIMLAGGQVHASRNSMVMIHDAMTFVGGAKKRLMRACDLLDKASDNIADMYAEKAGEDVEYWRAKMVENDEDGVWYTGAEALDAGLVDELTSEDDDERVDDYLSGWVNILPTEVAARLKNKTRDDDVIDATPPAAMDWAPLTDIMKGVFA